MTMPNWSEQSALLQERCEELGNVTTLRFDDITFVATTPKRSVVFRRTSAPPEGSARLVNNKAWTKRLLSEAGVKMPAGLTFRSPTTNVRDLRYPLVVKPVGWQFGQGVTTNVTTPRELRDAMKLALQYGRIERVLVEEHIQGDVYRLFVIGGKLVDATKIEPPNVTGDGVHTIAQLMAIRSELRRELPDSYPLQATLDLDLRLVPARHQRVMLSDKPHRTLGGDYFSAMKGDPKMLGDFRVLGKHISQTVGLPVNGIDVIVDGWGEVWTLECNAYPLFSVHLFPTQGRAVPVDALVAKHFLA